MVIAGEESARENGKDLCRSCQASPWWIMQGQCNDESCPGQRGGHSSGMAVCYRNGLPIPFQALYSARRWGRVCCGPDREWQAWEIGVPRLHQRVARPARSRQIGRAARECDRVAWAGLFCQSQQASGPLWDGCLESMGQGCRRGVPAAIRAGRMHP